MNTIDVVHVVQGLLEQASPPAWVGAQPGNLIQVKGKNYMVESVVGNTETGPAVIKVRS